MKHIEFGVAFKDRILQQSRLHQVGLSHADVFVSGLKRGIVQQRHLHGGLGGKWLIEQALDGFAGMAVIVR